MFQIAHSLYAACGDFEYNYKEPGSEFYLHLHCDCPDLKAKASEIVGWQAKFWLNRKDPDNSPMDAGHRAELVASLETALRTKPDIAVWIICTPGQISNTPPHHTADKLLRDLHKVAPNVRVLLWNKPIFEALLNKQPDLLGPIMWQYFGDHYFGGGRCRRLTKATIEELRERYDVDLYVPGSSDDDIWASIKISDSLMLFRARITELEWSLKRSDKIPKEDQEILPDRYKEAIASLRNGATHLAKRIVAFNNRIESLQQIHEIAGIMRDCWNELVDAYHRARDESPDKEKLQYTHFSLHDLLNNLCEVKNSVKGLLRNDLHVLASAGDGKTCLACDIADKCIKTGYPAILLSGLQLSGPNSIKQQIVEALGLPPTWSIEDVLGCLNNLGLLKGIRVPILIDGLNETIPDARRWRGELPPFIATVRQFRHVLLVTTTRSAYVGLVFGKEAPEDVENAINISGFSEYDVDIAVKRYFKKYNIIATNWTSCRGLFQRPLLLRMFCEVNRGSTVEVSHTSLFASVEEYAETLIKRAAQIHGDTDKYALSRLRKKVTEASQALWERNARSLGSIAEMTEVFDPGWDSRRNWRESFTSRVLDEGLLLSRQVEAEKEIVEFSYDLLAGIMIAKSIFFHASRQPIDVINDPETAAKLGDGDSLSTHPMAEDIVRALIYLWPTHCNGTQLMEVFPSPLCLRFSFEMLDVISCHPKGIKALQASIRTLEPGGDLQQIFSLGVIDALTLRGCTGPVPILAFMLRVLSGEHIDAAWSEAIRLRYYQLMHWFDRQADVSEEVRHVVLAFLGLLCASPLHPVRDNALVALIRIGRHPWEILKVAKILNGMPDIYIWEGIFAALCGTFLAIREPNEVQAVADELRAEIVPNISTNAWILDYCDTIFAHEACHGSLQNQPLGVDSKPASFCRV